MKIPGQDLEVKNNTELRNEIVTAMMQKFKSLIPGNIYQQYEEELKVIKRELLVEAINLNLRKFDIKAEEKYNQIMQKFRVLLEHDTEDSDTIIKNLPDSYSQFRAELLEKKIEKIKNDPEIIEAEKFSKEVINRTQYLFYRFLNEVKKYFEGISSQEDLQIFEKKINGLIPSIGTGGVDKMLEIIENHYNHGVKQARKFLNELQKSNEEKNNTNITELINFDGYFLTF